MHAIQQHDIQSTNETYHLPLIQAVARIIGAERNLLGGQCALNVTQSADLQTADRILSVSSKILKDSGGEPLSKRIHPLSNS